MNKKKKFVLIWIFVSIIIDYFDLYRFLMITFDISIFNHSYRYFNLYRLISICFDYIDLCMSIYIDFNRYIISIEFYFQFDWIEIKNNFSCISNQQYRIIIETITSAVHCSTIFPSLSQLFFSLIFLNKTIHIKINLNFQKLHLPLKQTRKNNRELKWKKIRFSMKVIIEK